ncbi:MAG: FecR domain-containing protein [Janthinobacterium lividum]
MPRTGMTTLLLSLATLCVPAFAQGTDPAVRDSFSTLNYVQGQATLDGQPLMASAISAPRSLHAGEVLATNTGSADVMLTPGTLLRVGQNTAVQLVSSDATRSEMRLESGRANVAVNMIRPDALLLVDLPNGQTQVLQRGLYTFDTATETVRVFNGEAKVFPGANTDTAVKPVKVKDQREVVLNDAHLHAVSFDRTVAQSDLLPWTGPQEAHADGDYGLQGNGPATSRDGFQQVGYGYGPYGFGEGYGYGGGYGWGFPYGFYGYPYGFYGYPFGLGIGFGYGGFYGRGLGYGGYGYRGGYAGGFQGGVAAGHGFAGGGFAGGGFHGGGRR